jgi:hypothetical protein
MPANQPAVTFAARRKDDHPKSKAGVKWQWQAIEGVEHRPLSPPWQRVRAAGAAPDRSTSIPAPISSRKTVAITYVIWRRAFSITCHPDRW